MADQLGTEFVVEHHVGFLFGDLIVPSSPFPVLQTSCPACTWSWSLSCWEGSRRMWKMSCRIRWEKVFTQMNISTLLS